MVGRKQRTSMMMFRAEDGESPPASYCQASYRQASYYLARAACVEYDYF